jgi:hypothetical protein
MLSPAFSLHLKEVNSNYHLVLMNDLLLSLPSKQVPKTGSGGIPDFSCQTQG